MPLAQTRVESLLSWGFLSASEHAAGCPKLRPASARQPFGAARAWSHGLVLDLGADAEDIGDIVRQELLRTPGLEHRSASNEAVGHRAYAPVRRPISTTCAARRPVRPGAQAWPASPWLQAGC